MSDEPVRATTGPGTKAYFWAVAQTAAVTAVLAPFHYALSPTTVALALLIAVLFVAANGGIGPAFAASALGMFCFNFFFLPPLHSLTVADPQHWVALAAFLVTAVTAGELSARARRRAEEAEQGRREIERLYTELRDAFDRASRAEALRQSEQLKSALLDAVTHDLRSPLTSIKASVTTLLDVTLGAHEAAAVDPAVQVDLLEVIDEETDRLNRSIGNLVEIARIEAGQMQLRRRWTAVDEVVAETIARAERLTRNHRVEIDVEADLPLVLADGRALAEVLYTLVENATKYSPVGTPIRIGASDAGGAVRVSVEDEGPGIPEALRERVFEKFFRIQSHPGVGANSPPGTGMGLAIARGIVETHGGRIWAETGSNERGTRIVFELPVEDETGENPQE